MEIARILIVEDEILVAREMATYLHEMQHEVVGIAIDAETVLQRVAATQPDLVLIDINLPGEQDGIALANEIRCRFQIPIVYVTAYADNATLERAKLTHPFGYVLKPFNQQDLRVSVELALFRLQTDANQPRQILGQSPGQTPGQTPGQISGDISNVGVESGIALNGLPPSKLQKVLDYIQNHLSQELSLDILSDQIGMTSYYFARLFKRSIGQSAHQYVIHQRIERAKQLLQNSELSIAEVSAHCGFANPSHLALHFKRIVGVSPKKFRFF